MKTKYVLSIIAFFSLIFIALTLQNVLKQRNRPYLVISFPEYEVCILMGEEYKLEFFENGFSYKAGKNSGVVKMVEGDFTEGHEWVRTNLGEFDTNYSKKKNNRTIEYKLGENMILLDDFHYTSRGALNPVPYKGQCEVFFEKFQDIKEIIFQKASL